MFSFDLSTINILITASVVALFIFYIIVLMKLNPSTETKENFETKIKVESKKLLQTSPIAPRNPPPTKIDIPRATEKPLVAINPTIEGSSIQTKQESPAPAKTESASSSKRDCIHQFGYLRTLPKNKPIPQECFGCTKIVECLINTKDTKR